MANGQRTTNTDIFDSLERLRLELKGDLMSNATDLRQDIRALRQDFNTMEAGRLTKAENNIVQLQLQVENQIAKLRANQSIQNSKTLLIWGLIVAALNFIVTFALRTVVK